MIAHIRYAIRVTTLHYTRAAVDLMAAVGATPAAAACYPASEWPAAAAQGEPADAWWAWHDQDSSRASATMEEAEERCAAWVAGTSDDGPDRT